MKGGREGEGIKKKRKENIRGGKFASDIFREKWRAREKEVEGGFKRYSPRFFSLSSEALSTRFSFLPPFSRRPSLLSTLVLFPACPDGNLE